MKVFSLCVVFFVQFVCQESQGLRIDFNPHDAISTTTTTTPSPSPSPLQLTPRLSQKCLKIFKDCRKSCFLFSCSTCYSLVIGCAFEEIFPPTKNTTMNSNGTTSANSTMTRNTTMNSNNPSMASNATMTGNSTNTNSTMNNPMARSEYDNSNMTMNEEHWFSMNSSSMPMELSTLPAEGSGNTTVYPGTKPMEGSGI